jgi:hypothetical protein
MTKSAQPSSSKHDAPVNPRSTGANGGQGNNAGGPYLSPVEPGTPGNDKR